jgi:hypothetical protein
LNVKNVQTNVLNVPILMVVSVLVTESMLQFVNVEKDGMITVNLTVVNVNTNVKLVPALL